MAHLRLTLAGQKRGNMVAKALFAQIDLAQAVKKEQTSLYDRVLKFAQDECAGRKPTDFEQTAAFGTAREQGLALVRWQRRTLCFGDQDTLDDRRKFLPPTPRGIGIPAAKTR